jgi:L-threonylcarbamoyladenylate synthase
MMPTSCPILPSTPANLQRCADLLRAGEVLGVPTETVYGLAGNALCQTAARQIFEVKGRPFIDPLIVHFHSIAAAAAHVELNDLARALAARFWPGALTLVLPKKPSIPDIVTAGLPSVAIRVPAHPVFRALLERIDFPLAAPSANPFGYVSPTLAAHVQATLGTRIPAVLDGGACQHGLESTIVDLRDPAAARILRPGPVSAETLGIRVTEKAQAANDGRAQAAPGMLTRHYSPNAAITLFAHGTQPQGAQAGEAILHNTKPPADALNPHSYWLSESGEPAEIAHNLFMLIQKLDNAGYSRLHVECAEDAGIGVAVNDRLRRAAAKRE